MDSLIDIYNIFAGFVERIYTDFFFWVLNTSISASFLVAAIILLRLILKKAPKAIIVALWGMVAIRLICPFSFESVLSLIPSEETIPTEQFHYQEARFEDYELQIVSNPIYPEKIEYKLPGYVENNSIDSMFAYFGWLGGMGVMLVYSAASYIIIKRKVRVSAPYKDNILLCDCIKTPFILGVFKPKIYLPSDIPDEEKEYVLAHEKAHLKRRDHWWKPLGFVLLSLHWFNPLMWVAYILLCRDIEFACDEKVIKTLGEDGKKPYSEALLNCSVPRKMIAACPVAFGETGVKDRIKSVLNYRKPAFWVIVVSVVSSIILAVCFLTNPVDNSTIFNAKYETGKCLYSFVITKEKETERNTHSFAINASGGVYKNYGNGEEGEYIGELKASSFTVKEMNNLLKNQGEKSIYLGRTGEIYEIIDETDDENAIDYVFIQKKNGDVVLINFFSDGNIMSIFELDMVKRFDDESVSENLDNNNSLDDDLSQFIGLCIADHYSTDKAEYLCAEHEVLGKKKFFNKTTVYLWVVAEGYSSDNGITLEHGSSVPTVITVEKEFEGFNVKGNGGYKLVEYWEPRDGSYYVKDIKDKFPWYLHNKVFGSREYTKELSEKCERKVMEYYGIDYAQFENIDDFNEKTFGKNLTLYDVIVLAAKGYDLTWADFEEFNYIETGSGLYIRHYDIDDMFTLWIGGYGPDTEPMYFYLHASDAWDEKIDIRDSDVNEFIAKHEKNPVVNNLSAGWHTFPVGYNEKALSKMYEIGGMPKYSVFDGVQTLPTVKLDNIDELKAFTSKMSNIMNFNASYPDMPSYNSISSEYNEEFFYGSSLILIYTSSPTTAHRYTVEYISESEGIISIGISEIEPEAGDTAMEGWLIAINVSKEQTANTTEFDTRISSVQYSDSGTANAKIIGEYIFKNSEEPIKPKIILYDNGMFQFIFSGFSSYVGIGKYTLNNGILTLNTDDNRFTYTFKASDDKLIFDAENSSDMLWLSDIYDGCVFE